MAHAKFFSISLNSIIDKLNAINEKLDVSYRGGYEKYEKAKVFQALASVLSIAPKHRELGLDFQNLMNFFYEYDPTIFAAVEKGGLNGDKGHLLKSYLRGLTGDNHQLCDYSKIHAE